MGQFARGRRPITAESLKRHALGLGVLVLVMSAAYAGSATAADLDVQDSFDPRDNIDGGVRHLKRLMARFHNNVPLALAAYNAGEQAVISHRGIPPYRETRQYVVRVLRRYDREAARLVAQQLAAPKSSTPKIVRVSYAGGRAVTAPVIPVLADAEEEKGAQPEKKKKSESP